jgi:hypothetical protein
VTLDFSRIFGMSAFEALRLVRVHQREFPNLDFHRASELVKRIYGHSGGLDFTAALELSELISVTDEELADLAFYQKCIEKVISSQRPTWLRIIAFGRQHFTEKLSRDELHCFRSAGLLDAPPSSSVVAWWDRVAAESRQLTELARMERARKAERLTIEFERCRLKALGIVAEPRWTAIEDNHAGYDVHSYDPGETAPIARLIEVKSTIATPSRFILSRNEWMHADRFGSAYYFHVWDLRTDPPILHQLTFAQVRVHIPTNNEDGRWTDVEIPLASAES